MLKWMPCNCNYGSESLAAYDEENKYGHLSNNLQKICPTIHYMHMSSTHPTRMYIKKGDHNVRAHKYSRVIIQAGKKVISHACNKRDYSAQ